MKDPEREQEIIDRLTHGEVMAEPEVMGHREPPSPVSSQQVKRRCSLSHSEWRYIESIPEFRRRYLAGPGMWNAYAPYVINAARTVLLRYFKSDADFKREKEERAKQHAEKKAARDAAKRAATVKPDGTPYRYSPEARAALAKRVKDSWAKRKAKESGSEA